MEQWERIRHQILIEGKSKRSVMRSEGIHWDTLQRMLRHSSPPGYAKRSAAKERKIDPFVGWIEGVLAADQALPRKQRHTAKRIFDRLREERGYTGGYTVVKDVVRELTRRGREVFVPLVHRPGEGQVDFGHALVSVRGALRKVAFFVMSLPYSDAVYVQVFARETTETFLEGHRRAFDFFGGVPSRISYDNSKIAVKRIVGAHERELTDAFLGLRSHYLFASHFCRVARGNEKGVVESMVRYVRSNFLIPVPPVNGLDELDGLNAELEAACRRELSRTLRGKVTCKEALLAEEQAVLRPVPEGAFEACKTLTGRSNSLSLVRFDRNDYSVPVSEAHRQVVIKGFAERVCIYHDGRLLAEHRRLWDKERIAFDPVHYLRLLETKPGAFDYALPLSQWTLPQCFATLRTRLENDDPRGGVREYIRVLRLLEHHPLGRVAAAIDAALDHGASSRDAIAQHLYHRERPEAKTFSLAGREHLQGVTVTAPRIGHYSALLQRKEAS